MSSSYELYKNAFFLHSFLDENIGNNKGNDIINAVQTFQKYWPNEMFQKATQSLSLIIDEYIKIQQVAIRPVLEHYEIASKIFVMTMYPHDETNPNVLRYKNRYFLKKQTTSMFNDYADIYQHKDIHIDNKCEIQINEDISSLIDIILSKSLPQFIPYGFKNYNTGHMIGILLTKTHIIITNSGDGIQYHTISQIHPFYPQCILYFNKPSPHHIKSFIKSLIHLKNSYTNTTVQHTYAPLFKLYFLQLVESYNKERIISITKEFIHKCFTNTNNIRNIFAFKPPFEPSVIKQIPWIHPEYHSQTSYNISINYDNIQYDDIIMPKLINMFASLSIPLHQLVQQIIEQFIIKCVNNSHISINNIVNVTKDHKMALISALTVTPNILCNLNESKLFIINKIINEDPFQNTMSKYYIQYATETIVQQIKNKTSKSDEEILKSEEYKREIQNIVVISELNLNINTINLIWLSLSQCIKLDKTIWNQNECDSLEIIITKKFNELIQHISLSLPPPTLANLPSTIDDDTYKNLFVDILVYDTTIQNNTIIVTSNNFLYTQNYDNISPTTPTYILLSLIKTQLPDLYIKLSAKKLNSIYPNNFFVREQFAGSCTFNATLLTASLFTFNLYNKPTNLSIKQYIDNHANILSEIRKKQLDEIKINKNTLFNEKDRLIIKALQFTLPNFILSEPHLIQIKNFHKYLPFRETATLQIESSKQIQSQSILLSYQLSNIPKNINA